MVTNIYFSKKQMIGFKGAEPDLNVRLDVILKYLNNSDLKFKLISPNSATENQLLLAHDPKYLNELKNPVRLNKYFPDEPLTKGTYTVLKLSAGTAIDACEYSFKNKKFSFALTRPKGNFAGYDFFGNFSYINNMAVAVLNLLNKNPNLKVLIFDFDAHFCKGTNDIFKDNPNVYIVSIHQFAETIFPYTGKEKESKEHLKLIENRLWINDDEFLENVRNKALPYIEEVKPDIICVSAGFNLYFKDLFYGTTSNIRSPSTFKTLAKMLNTKAREIDAPIFAILEGGYWVEDLGELVYNFLKGFDDSVKKKLPDVISDGSPNKNKLIKKKKTVKKVDKKKTKTKTKKGEKNVILKKSKTGTRKKTNKKRK
jgi:acetoin utilization deacetylase AcuC-like enzyme